MTSPDESEPGEDTPRTRPGGPPSEPLERNTLESEYRPRPAKRDDALCVEFDPKSAEAGPPGRIGRATSSIGHPPRAGSLSSSTTQESVAIDPAEIDRSLLAERRISVLEDELNQLNARIRLAEKSVEDTRRLAMASALFTLVALVVLKWFFR